MFEVHLEGRIPKVGLDTQVSNKELLTALGALIADCATNNI